MKYFLQKKGWLTKDVDYYYKMREKHICRLVNNYCDSLIDSSIKYGTKYTTIADGEEIIQRMVSELKRRGFKDVYVAKHHLHSARVGFSPPPEGVEYEVY